MATLVKFSRAKVAQKVRVVMTVQDSSVKLVEAIGLMYSEPNQTTAFRQQRTLSRNGVTCTPLPEGCAVPNFRLTADVERSLNFDERSPDNFFYLTDSRMEPSQIIDQIAACSTPADAAALIQWSKAMMRKIERGDMMIGIVSIDEARMIPIALRKALDTGVAEAGLCLADWLLTSPLDEPDLAAAEVVLLESIALGMDEACVPLMKCRWIYRRDACTDQEAKQAFILLEKWCAKNPEDSEALYLLGLVTCHGFGTSADPGQSARILDVAVRLGNADAMFELFLYYANGIGVAKDESVAIEFLLRAGEAGQTRAMYNLGAFHATGRYVPMDQALAVDWYTRAANAGHVKAANTLATMYENGLGVEPDKALAQRFRDMFE